MDAAQGTPAKDARLIIGAVIIKHKENLSDEDTIELIKENVYMQYFVGLSSFSNQKIFEPSLFVAIRKRLDAAFWQALNEIIIASAEQRCLPITRNNADLDHAAPTTLRETSTSLKNSGELLLYHF